MTQIWNELPACILVRFKTKTTWRVEGIDEDNRVSRRAAKETVVFGQGAKAATSPCDAEAVSIGSRVCNHRSCSPRANLQRRRCHGHAHWGSRRPIDSLHCVNAGPRQAWFVCVQTVPAAPFQKGAKVGRKLLLRFWGGEKMDWSALRAKYRDERECKECNESKPASAFTAGRWKRQDAARVCKECIRRHVETQMPWQCMAMHGLETGRCIQGKTCKPTSHILSYLCDVRTDTNCVVSAIRAKDEMKFSAAMWKRARNGGRVCLLVRRRHGAGGDAAYAT